MTNSELKVLVEGRGGDMSKLEYDYSEFKTEELCTECCPDCGDELEIKQDGSTDCPECGHPEVLPCSQCPLNDLYLCDWNKETRCSAFPK